MTALQNVALGLRLTKQMRRPAADEAAQTALVRVGLGNSFRAIPRNYRGVNSSASRSRAPWR